MSVGQNEVKKGAMYALACYAFWGIFPLFWYPINQSEMPAMQILAQRIVWSAVFAVILLSVCRQWHAVRQACRQPKLLLVLMASSVLIGANWLIYLWSIMNHRVVDASLGYFINPLVSVLLGFVFLRERLNRTQMIALLLALAGILWLAIPAGQIPWVALSLAMSFGLYGLIRKLAPLPALAGLALETFLLAPFALMYLLWQMQAGQLYWQQLTHLQMSIVLLSGAATTIPLLMFAAGAKRIPLSLLGMLQYISPTLQLILGIVLFDEILQGARLAGYVLVWCGVLVFTLGAWLSLRQTRLT